MDEVADKAHTRFRLFGFWKRYRAKEDQKLIEEMASPGYKDVLAAQEAIWTAYTDARDEQIRDCGPAV